MNLRKRAADISTNPQIIIIREQGEGANKVISNSLVYQLSA